MPRFWIVALAVIVATGLLVVVVSRPSACWHPGLARNNPIAIPVGCEQEEMR